MAGKKRTEMEGKEVVNHPPHYGGQDNPYEAIKVIEAWEVGFHLGNVLKYISRAGKKYKSKWRSARALSDKIFFLGMKAAEPSVPSWKIYSAYWAVRAFGRWPASAKDV